jgi:hypothetical protein
MKERKVECFYIESAKQSKVWTYPANGPQSCCLKPDPFKFILKRASHV